MKASRFASLENSALTIFFLFPLIYLLTKFNSLSAVNPIELMQALKISVFQSAAATLICVAAGLPSAIAFNNLSLRLQKAAKLFLILPQALPVIFTILIVFSIINPFPMGNVGVIILFCVVNFGLSVIVLAEAIRQKIGRSALVGEIYGINRMTFWNKILMPAIFKDIIRCFYLVFVFCFASFSIPLVAGGGRSVNFEILIYEKIFVQTDWNSAVSLAIMQSLFVFLLAMPASSVRNKISADSYLNSKLLKSNFGYLLIFGYVFLYAVGYFQGLIQSLSYIDFVSTYADELWSALVGSMHLFFMMSGFSLLIIYLVVRSFVSHEKMPLILNYLSPSTVVVGFSIYLLFAGGGRLDSYKFIFAFSILALPALFKLFIQSRLQQLTFQVKSAKIFGLTHDSIIFKIIYPQIKKSIGLFLSVQAFWILGDYSISRAIGLQTSTLGLVAESFLSGYRLQAAYLISALILIIWGCISAVIYYLVKDSHVKSS